jgi:hypothetical protein
MKKALSKVGAILMGSLVVVVVWGVMFAAIWYATSAEVWHAGEHTEDCDGSQDCGCYKKLLELDKANIQNLRSGKR